MTHTTDRFGPNVIDRFNMLKYYRVSSCIQFCWFLGQDEPSHFTYKISSKYLKDFGHLNRFNAGLLLFRFLERIYLLLILSYVYYFFSLRLVKKSLILKELLILLSRFCRNLLLT